MTRFGSPNSPEELIGRCKHTHIHTRIVDRKDLDAEAATTALALIIELHRRCTREKRTAVDDEGSGHPKINAVSAESIDGAQPWPPAGFTASSFCQALEPNLSQLDWVTLCGASKVGVSEEFSPCTTVL